MTTRPSVCLAVSSFRNDESVAKLLEAAKQPNSFPFSHILIVDSLGTDAVPDLIAREGWNDVSYVSAQENLGSAGNLAKRLELSAARDCKYVYALNHDGYLDAEAISELVRAAEAVPHIGAAYPLRFLAQKRQADSAGRHGRIPLPWQNKRDADDGSPYSVHWSSSNGTLYALEPVRNGLLPWADLWMGWEDLGYGGLLRAHGYEQIVVPTARWRDDYEYQSHQLLGRSLHVSNKPAWYAYYQARNLLLIARRLRSSPTEYAAIGARIAMEIGATTLFKNEKLTRYRLLATGVADGLRARAGKWTLP